ncbi:hypothetical protein bcere0022_45810 [Bacillus cereus Rock3-44]|nr:hypothetical protein bcere0022_45810 [Bacillus cereus Rock3-44]
MLELQTPIYFIFSFGLYSFALYHYYKNHIKNFRNQEKSQNHRKEWGA